MELGEIQYNENIDGILWMGHPGTSGVMAVGKILTGEVNPSGRLVDMYPADFSKDPTWYNFGDNSQNHYNTTTKEFDDSFINVRSADDPTEQYRGFLSVDYEEGIYMGYRWYETADAEGYFDKAQAAGAFTAEDAGVKANGGDNYYNTYNGVVYPFGYGLSYTTFDWEITTEGGTWNGKDAITVSVKVTNTGDVAGKDVVQIYSSAPYYEGGIEKAAADLVDYAKTDLLEPGDSQTLTSDFSKSAASTAPRRYSGFCAGQCSLCSLRPRRSCFARPPSPTQGSPSPASFRGSEQVMSMRRLLAFRRGLRT